MCPTASSSRPRRARATPIVLWLCAAAVTASPRPSAPSAGAAASRPARGRAPLVVLDRGRVGVHAARPLAGRHQVARASGFVGAEGPVMAEGHQPLETLGAAGTFGLEGGGHTGVELGASRHENVLVHDLL